MPLAVCAQAEAQRRGPGITDEALEHWHASLSVHTDFRWPTTADGEHMFAWDADANDAEFEGMHGDEMAGWADDEVDEEEQEPNPFEDVKDKAGKFEPVAPRMYPMERRGYSIFGGVFRKKEPEGTPVERPLPQISDQLWPKYGTYK